jgi:Zn-dependent peptidase ImmA (M78 family)
MIGARLKRARDAAGMSLRDLEGAIGRQVSAQAIGKYERDEMMPGSTVLLAMADALSVRPDYLMGSADIQLAGVDFRKAPAAGAREEKTVEAVVLDQLERYLAMEDLIPGAEANWSAPQDVEFVIKCIEDAEAAADRLRAIWELGLDPIPSVADLLEEKGIKVIAVELPEQVSGSKAFVQRAGHDDVPVIVVNKRHNAVRQRFTLVHELAHLVLRCVGLTEAEEERAADRFAGAFLMARRMMERLLGKTRRFISIGELSDLQRLFKVSLLGLAVRCTQLGILDKTSGGKLCGHLRKNGFDKPSAKEPNTFESEVPRRLERLCLRAVGEGLCSASRAAEALRISTRDFEQLQAGI